MESEFPIDHPDLEKLFERYTSSPESYVFAPLADACRKAGRLGEALEICSRGIAMHPDYASGHVIMGKCYYDMKEREKAEEAFRRVLSLDEDNLVALKFLGMISAERGDESAATNYFKHILALDPESAEIQRELQRLQEKRAPAEATESLEEEEILELAEMPDEDFEGKAIELGAGDETSDDLATMTLAEIYASQGYPDKARKIYREVLKKQPGNKVARQKLRELEPKDTAAEDSSTAREDLADSEMEALTDEGTGSEFEWGEERGDTDAGERSVRSQDVPPDSKADREAEDVDERAAQESKREETASSREQTRESGRMMDDKGGLKQFKKWLDRMDD